MKHLPKKLVLGFALIVAAVLLITAVTASRRPVRPTRERPPTMTPWPGPTPTWGPTPAGALGPYGFPANVNPLTGLTVDNPAILKKRPLAIKISNAPPLVRPQAGLGDADLVFEHLTEGQLTRFTAIFWSKIPARVGSVRSARLIDLEIVQMYGALFAFSGASDEIRARIFASPFAARAFEGVSVGPPVFYRDDSIEIPHNMFANPKTLLTVAEKRGMNTPPALQNGMFFSPAPQPKGGAGTLIRVDYGPTQAEWRYDAKTGRYTRRTDGAPHLDANTKKPITAANVVILYAWHQPDPNIPESEFQGNKSYSLEIQLWTPGPALVCRDGQCVRGVWNRQDKDYMLSFWTEDRQPIYFKPGNTWFQVVNLPEATQIQQTIRVS